MPTILFPLEVQYIWQIFMQTIGKVSDCYPTIKNESLHQHDANMICATEQQSCQTIAGSVDSLPLPRMLFQKDEASMTSSQGLESEAKL